MKNTGVFDYKRHSVKKRASHEPRMLPGHGAGSEPDLGPMTTVEVPTVAVEPVVTGAVDIHEAAADPHSGYQKESEKSQPDGYASLGPDGLVPLAELPSLAQALDDLTDVVVTAEAAGDRLRFDGADWVNTRRVWMPLTTVIAGVPEFVWDSDDSLVPTEVPT
jgi:hypothetical protein